MYNTNVYTVYTVFIVNTYVYTVFYIYLYIYIYIVYTVFIVLIVYEYWISEFVGRGAQSAESATSECLITRKYCIYCIYRNYCIYCVYTISH